MSAFGPLTTNVTTATQSSCLSPVSAFGFLTGGATTAAASDDLVLRNPVSSPRPPVCYEQTRGKRPLWPGPSDQLSQPLVTVEVAVDLLRDEPLERSHCLVAQVACLQGTPTSPVGIAAPYPRTLSVSTAAVPVARTSSGHTTAVLLAPTRDHSRFINSDADDILLPLSIRPLTLENAPSRCSPLFVADDQSLVGSSTPCTQPDLLSTRRAARAHACRLLNAVMSNPLQDNPEPNPASLTIST